MCVYIALTGNACQAWNLGPSIRLGTSVQDLEAAPQCLEAGRKDLEGFHKLQETFQNYLTLSGSFHEFHMNFVHAKNTML